MVLDNLQPARVMYYFEEISAVPRGSGDTKRISDRCVELARALGLECRQDEYNNVIIRKPASAGYEDHPAVILQGHLDMVCEKEPDSDHDFSRDGIRLMVDGDWITADGTTLGGDNGIAVAMTYALLEDDTAAHPPLVAIFTTDEETGMNGAIGLDASDIDARLLINIDSEDEGVLTVGCAGGARAVMRLPLTRAAAEMPCYTVTVDGLIGGHSGVEINAGRLNANRLLAEFLQTLPAGWRLADIGGGLKENAIPRRAQCVICAPCDYSAAAAAFADARRVDTDPDLTITVTPTAAVDTALTAAESQRVANFLAALPNGVQAMSAAIDGLVETSLNLGIMHMEADTLVAICSVRSSVTADKTALLAQLREIAEQYGGSFEELAHYPAWEYRAESRLRDTMVAVYERLYGVAPQVAAIHAGLECGLFCEKMAGLDAVSFGPDMRDIHTTQERLSIPSVARTYDYLRGILAAL